MSNSTPPNESAAPRALSPDAAFRKEEFGDLNQAADQYGTAREYYADALREIAPGDAAARSRLLLKLAECDYRQERFADALARLEEAHAASRPLADPVLTGTLAARMAAAHVASDLGQGDSVGVQATPTLFFNDRKYEGPLHPKYITMWIEEELAVNR